MVTQPLLLKSHLKLSNSIEGRKPMFKSKSPMFSDFFYIKGLKDVSATGQLLNQSRRTYVPIVCVSLDMITCSNNLIHLQQVDRKGQTKGKRKD
jgi:hypothetical protein